MVSGPKPSVNSPQVKLVQRHNFMYGIFQTVCRFHWQQLSPSKKSTRICHGAQTCDSYALLEIWQRPFCFCFGGEGREKKKLLMVWEDSIGSCRRPASFHSVGPASVWYRLQGNSPARASAAPFRCLSCGKLSASPEPLAASSSRHGYNILCVVVM